MTADVWTTAEAASAGFTGPAALLLFTIFGLLVAAGAGAMERRERHRERDQLGRINSQRAERRRPQ